MSFEIRPAMPPEREFFLDLAFGYLEDSGGELLVTPRNLAIFGFIFDQYVNGDSPGVVLLAYSDEFPLPGPETAPVAATMAGVFPNGFDTIHGRTAMGWLTFVDAASRRKGIARAMRRQLDVRLRALGFETVIGGYHVGNEAAEASLAGADFVPYQTLGAKRLTTEE